MNTNSLDILKEKIYRRKTNLINHHNTFTFEKNKITKQLQFQIRNIKFKMIDLQKTINGIRKRLDSTY